MKLFPLLLAGTLLVPSAALAGNNNNGNGCRNRCGDTVTNNYEGSRDYNDHSNTASGGNGYGGAGGQGGAGGNANSSSYSSANGGNGYGGNAHSDGGDVRNSGNSRNENSNSQTQGQSSRNTNSNRVNSSNTNSTRSSSAANNNGNSQSTTVSTGGNTYTQYGDLPETAVAPLPGAGQPGQIGDIVVPLTTINMGGFASGSNYNDIYGSGNNARQDYGVSIGINIPLGAGQFREYAANEAQRRADRAQFRLIQEAIFLRDNGVLSEEAHPRHYAALYGSK